MAYEDSRFNRQADMSLSLGSASYKLYKLKDFLTATSQFLHFKKQRW